MVVFSIDVFYVGNYFSSATVSRDLHSVEGFSSKTLLVQEGIEKEDE